ncbi:MAG: DUF6335 family protein [Cyanobacteria bacterium J06606_4]
MEKTDSQPKQTAVDSKGAFAGNPGPDPELGIDQLGTAAGLDIQPETPLATREKLESRDENRFELDPNSAASPATSDMTNFTDTVAEASQP